MQNISIISLKGNNQLVLLIETGSPLRDLRMKFYMQFRCEPSKKRYGVRVFSEYVGFPLSISFHQCSILIFVVILSSSEVGEACELSKQCSLRVLGSSGQSQRSSKGRFTHSMPCPCHAHPVPLPCHAAKGLECAFPI